MGQIYTVVRREEYEEFSAESRKTDATNTKGPRPKENDGGNLIQPVFITGIPEPPTRPAVRVGWAENKILHQQKILSSFWADWLKPCCRFNTTFLCNT